MNAFVLYLLLLKATLTSFSGLASLPIIRNDLVVQRHVLSDHQLNTAVAVGRIGPGPVGLYVVSVGYFAAGYRGAVAGLLATVTPAFLVLPLLRYVGTRAGTPRVKSAIRAVMLAGAGLLLAATVPLARDAVSGALALAIVSASFFALSFTRVDSAWVMLAAAVAGLVSATIR